MALFTLAEVQNLGLDDLQAGLAETVITVSDFLGVLPVMPVAGNAYVFNREKTGIDGQLIAADGTITDSSALDIDRVSLALQGISGQYDITGLTQAQGVGANAGNDPEVIANQAAAKGIARKFNSLVIGGTVGANQFDGLVAAVESVPFAAQLVDAAGVALSFAMIDDAKSRVVSKGSQVDFLMGNAKTENKIKALLRASGGVTTLELNGKYFVSYDGVPFIRNDYAADGYLFAGNFEEGTKDGVALVVPQGDIFRMDAPIVLEAKDATRYRMKMYGSLAIHNIRGLSAVKAFI